MTSEPVRIALAWLGTYAVHSTLLLGGVWGLCLLRPPRAPRSRERLWKLAMVGGVLSATLQLGLGARPLFGHLRWSPDPLASLDSRPVREAPAPALRVSSPPEERELASPGTAEEQPEEPAAPRHETHPRPSLAPTKPAQAIAPETPPHEPPLRVAAEIDSARTLTPAEAPREAGTTKRKSWTIPAFLRAPARAWPGFVLIGWVGVCTLGLAGVVLSWNSLRRRLLGREELRDGPLVARLEELRRRAGLKRRVRLSVSQRIRAPFSTGVLRPEICLPAAALTDLSSSQVEALLAHELAHLLRGDPAWFGTCFLIERLFFFQPLNRLARKELSELAEMACDDWAVRWTGARLALASCLTEVAEWVIGERPQALAMPCLAGSTSRLGRRITRLLDDRRSPSSEPRDPWWLPLATVTLAGTVLAVPGVSATVAPAESARQPGVAASAKDEVRPSVPSVSSEESPEPVAERRVEGERALLEVELELLQSEITALHAELEQRELRERFAEPLERIDTRMAELREQHQRVLSLLEKLDATRTPATAPPTADR